MAATDKRCAGTVKWFSARKGFGFIAPDDGSEDLFVHQTSIQSDGFRTLSDGQPVEYSVELGEDGRAKASEVVGVSRSRSTSRGRGSAGGRRGFADGRGRGSGRYSSGGGGGYGRGGWGGRSEAAGGGGGGGGACYNCGRYGHLARDCYQGTGGGGGGGGSRRYGGGGGSCYSCGDEGHFARDCPNTDRN